MGAYILRRLLIAIPVLLGITFIGFIVLKLTPGDPLLANESPEVVARMLANPEILEAERRRLGLDQPIFPNQYATWLLNVVRGDLGYSIMTHRSVASEIGSRLPRTMLLMVPAISLAVLISVPIGIVAAIRQHSKLDYALSAGSLFLASTPVFVLGLMLIYVFAVGLHLVPTGQLHSPGQDGFLDAVHHLILPATMLAIVMAAPLLRYTRASMLDVLLSDYITTARAKGLRERTVTIRHALRNAMIPIITVVALLIPEAITGAVVTEQIFAWNGMGQLAVSAANARDPSLMMGIILLTGIAVLLTSIVADVGYALADPRIRYNR